jgi:hypothetical protein
VTKLRGWTLALVGAFGSWFAAFSADSDECGQSFRSKADSVLIDCGQHSDGPGQRTHVDGCKGVMTRD